MLAMLGVLFGLCGYSLVISFVINMESDSIMSHLFETSYLFLHLVIIGIIFYLTFRALMKGSAIMANIMMKDHNKKNIVTMVISAILGVLVLLVGIYASLIAFNAPVPLSNIFAGVVSHAIMNACFLATMLAISFFIFPFLYNENVEAVSA